MSRSFRNNLVFPNCCCNSQKKWKQHYNRVFRRRSKNILHTYLTSDKEDYVYEDVYKRSYADIWNSPSDGKSRYEVLSKKQFLLIQEKYNFYRYTSYKRYLDYIKRRLISK